MYFLLLRYFLLQLIISLSENTSVISEEKYDLVNDGAHEAMDFDSHKANRRFYEDLKDDEWHVAHLRDEGKGKDEGFGEASCRRLTFDERAHRYKRILKEDGSRVKFVSADPIPVDENITDFIDPCMTANGTRIEEDEETYKRASDPINNTTVIERPLDLNNTVDNVTNSARAATTAAVKKDLTTESNRHSNKNTTDEVKEGLTTKSDSKHGKRRKNRREGEDYQFSSVEYYDEMLEFDESQCPDDVKVITLQVDQLRAYDIECEIMTEWRSLE